MGGVKPVLKAVGVMLSPVARFYLTIVKKQTTSSRLSVVLR